MSLQCPDGYYENQKLSWLLSRPHIQKVLDEKVIGLHIRDAQDYITKNITLAGGCIVPESHKDTHQKNEGTIYLYGDRNRIVTGALIA